MAEDGLSCSICFNDYDENSHLPVVSICGHCFCKSCSNSLPRRPGGGGRQTIECPNCRVVATLPLANNYSLISLLRYWRANIVGQDFISPDMVAEQHSIMAQFTTKTEKQDKKLPAQKLTPIVAAASAPPPVPAPAPSPTVSYSGFVQVVSSNSRPPPPLAMPSPPDHHISGNRSIEMNNHRQDQGRGRHYSRGANSHGRHHEDDDEEQCAAPQLHHMRGGRGRGRHHQPHHPYGHHHHMHHLDEEDSHEATPHQARRQRRRNPYFQPYQDHEGEDPEQVHHPHHQRQQLHQHHPYSHHHAPHHEGGRHERGRGRRGRGRGGGGRGSGGVEGSNGGEGYHSNSFDWNVDGPYF
jgi:hypothetical protein